MPRRTPEVASFAKSVLCFQHFNIAIIYRFQVQESCSDSFWRRTGVMEEKFSQKKRGYPAGRMLFADRRMTMQPHVGRQDNYHPLRQLMLNIQTLDRMIARGAAPFPPAGAA